MFRILKNILLTWYSYCVKCYYFGMLTRRGVTRACERQRKYLFKSCDSFPNGILPTKRDVLQRLLYEKEISEQELQLSLLQMNYMNVGSTVMFIA